MRRALLTLVFLLLVVSPAQAAYDHGSAGPPAPAALGATGSTTYSASITGKASVVDLVFVLDNSGSMNGTFSSGLSRWDALRAATQKLVNGLGDEGFFARGGKVGVVTFSETASTGTAPTNDTTAISNALNAAVPTTTSCIGCGLQRASELLSAVPGSAAHRRLVYLVADGANTVTPPTIAEALASANAAGVERRVIGLGTEAQSTGLEAIDSDGSVPYPTDVAQLASAYAAQPTKLPGATNLSWTFHLTPGFAASAPVPSKGSVAIAGSDVTWTIPSLGEETATLSFRATHAAASGCAATALLSGSTFADAEGDAAPPDSPGPLSLSGCTGPKLKPAAVILLPKSPSKCSHRRTLSLRVRPPKGTSVKRVSVKIGARKAKTFTGKRARAGISLGGLPRGKFKVKVTVTLGDGRSVTLTRRYWTCPAS